MPVSYSSISCSEEYGTRRDIGDVNTGIGAQVTLRCAWADRYLLMDDLLSTPQPWPFATGVIPYAMNAVAVPAGVADNDGQACGYQDALVTVTYNTQIIDTASEAIEPTLDYDVEDYRKFRWASGTGDLLTEGESPPRILRAMNIVRTRYRLSAIPDECLTCIGKVNNATYTSSLLGLTFAAETLLFEPAPLIRSFTNFGSQGFTMTNKFGFKPNGWNKFWRTSTETYERIYLKGSATPYRPYPLGDFSALFL